MSNDLLTDDNEFWKQIITDTVVRRDMDHNGYTVFNPYGLNEINTTTLALLKWLIEKELKSRDDE